MRHSKFCECSFCNMYLDVPEKPSENVTCYGPVGQPVLSEDSIVQSVVNKFKKRSEIGIEKYGVTLDRDDLSLYDWLNHLQEELMDAVNYIEKLKKVIGGKEKV